MTPSPFTLRWEPSMRPTEKSVYVSVVIPTLNAASKLEACLSSVRKQDLAEPLYEIVVADGGSTDATVDIARRFGALVVPNEYRLAEPGVVVGARAARGKVIAVMAADNRFVERDALRKLVAALGDESVAAAFPLVSGPAGDSMANRYISRCSDPFTHFVYREWSSLEALIARGRTTSGSASSRLIEFPAGRHPLVALAQGCTIRREFVSEREPGSADDVIALMDAADTGGRLAILPDCHVEHDHVAGLRSVFVKYRRRTRESLSLSQGYRMRQSRVSKVRRLRAALWAPYSATLVLPAFDGLYLWARRRDPLMLYHPVINAVVMAAFTREVVAALGGLLPHRVRNRMNRPGNSEGSIP